MIEFDNIDVSGIRAAVRGMRNPMNSWDKSDGFYCDDGNCGMCVLSENVDKCSMINPHDYCIGEEDLKLMQKLANAGTDHSKFLRMIHVQFDVNAPLYWWKEFDTYKVGTVRNSCSTMHKIASKEFTLDDFSHEHLMSEWKDGLTETIKLLNYARERYIDTKSKQGWWQMIQLLPSSYNQRATIDCNYQVLRTIRNSDRKTHKLDEWRIGFMNFIDSLPYAKELLIKGDTSERTGE